MSDRAHYYLLHEVIYQNLQAQGKEAWGAQDFEDSDLMPFLKKILERLPLAPGARILELGCGTGPLSCALAQAGFSVDGIDVSATAIEMAQGQAKRRGLSAYFSVSDLCRDPLKAGEYDLIIDAHCLHCIALEDERKLALANIHQALKPGGHFASEMMMGHDTGFFTGTNRLDEQGRVWKDSDLEGSPREFKDGRWWILQRFIRDQPEEYDRELEAAGFNLVWREVEATPGEPKDYQALLQRQ